LIVVDELMAMGRPESVFVLLELEAMGRPECVFVLLEVKAVNRNAIFQAIERGEDAEKRQVGQNIVNAEFHVELILSKNLIVRQSEVRSLMRIDSVETSVHQVKDASSHV
jgi:hypothetical protein